MPESKQHKLVKDLWGFVAKWTLNGFTGEGISSTALPQGGLDLVLTTLMITGPPMAAAFFQGTLGQFTAYSALGHLDQASQDGSGGRPQAAAPAPDNKDSGAENTSRNNVVRGESVPSQEPDKGSRGLAQK